MKIKTILIVVVALFFASSCYAQKKGLEEFGKEVKKIKTYRGPHNPANPYTAEKFKKNGGLVTEKKVLEGVERFLPKNSEIAEGQILEKNLPEDITNAVIEPERTADEKKFGDEGSSKIAEGVWKRLTDFCALNNRYPQKYFFKEGEKIPEKYLTAAQKQEEVLFEEVEIVFRRIPHNVYAQRMREMKEAYAKSAVAMEEERISETEQIYVELRDFALEHNYFPKQLTEKEIERFNGELQIQLRKEVALREKIERLMSERPNDKWVQQMQALQKDFAD